MTEETISIEPYWPNLLRAVCTMFFPEATGYLGVRAAIMPGAGGIYVLDEGYQTWKFTFGGPFTDKAAWRLLEGEEAVRYQAFADQSYAQWSDPQCGDDYEEA